MQSRNELKSRNWRVTTAGGTHQSKHLRGFLRQYKGENGFNDRHSPSKPGASGILFRSWGTTMRTAPDEMICGNRAFKSCSRRAIKTCPIVTWARIQPTVNKRSVKKRASFGRVTCMSISRLTFFVPFAWVEKLSKSTVSMLKLEVTSIVAIFRIGIVRLSNEIAWMVLDSV